MKAEDTLLQRVAATIDRHRMLQPGQRVAVAVSGGADSVCLLHVLRELAPSRGLHLSVLHLNHGLRGEESHQDAAFVRQLAAELGLPATIQSTDVAASPDNVEQAGREARLAFFRQQITAGAADRVAVGHTRDDQAETVLFRFLRGSATAGLAGIRPVTADGMVRPLLEVDRAEVRRYLRERNIVWREDSTNAALQFARNRIRHQLLPQLAREWNPAITETLARTAAWALGEEDYWEAEIGRLAAGLLLDRDGTILARVDSLVALPKAAARRLVRRAMERAKGDLRTVDFEHVEAVLRTAQDDPGHGRIQAPGLDIMRSFDWLRFSRPGTDGLESRNYRIAAPVPGTVRVPGAGTVISLELIEKAEASATPDCVYNGETGCLNWRFLSGSLELRNWRPGDQYQPWGTAGEEKIKTLFQDARIPLWERRHWPILMDGSSIVWARRFGPAARFAAGSDTAIVLRIRETAVP